MSEKEEQNKFKVKKDEKINKKIVKLFKNLGKLIIYILAIIGFISVVWIVAKYYGINIGKTQQIDDPVIDEKTFEPYIDKESAFSRIDIDEQNESRIKMKDKAIEQAKANGIIEAADKNAQNDARKAVDELNKEEFEIRRLEDLRRQFDIYKAKMEALLISQLELLQDDKENKN